MPNLEILLFLTVLNFSATVAALVFAIKTSKELQLVRYLADENSMLIQKLTQELNVKRSLNKPSSELTDFLRDLQTHGYGAIRVDPDTVFVRSPREH
jgi:hypothetical protein